MPSFKLYLMGPPRLEKNGEAVAISRRKEMALLAYLAVTHKPHSRDSLATLFWPDNDQSSALANLRRELSRLNQKTSGQVLTIDRMQVSLNQQAELWLDRDAFMSNLKAVREHDDPPEDLCEACLERLLEAVALYQDDFLSGFSLPDSPGFDDWQFFETEELRQAFADALQRLVHCYFQSKEYEQAIPFARRWLALDTLHEPAHRLLMHLYALSGQQAAALRQYQELSRLLKEELGVKPERETIELYEAVRTRQLTPPKADEEIRSPPGFVSEPASENALSTQPFHPDGPDTLPSNLEKTGEISSPSTQPTKTIVHAPTQQVHMCTSPDGVKIAYATTGHGPWLVKAANWLSHLEFDWDSPVWRHWIKNLSRYHTLVRYDKRGTGLSDWQVDMSFEAFVTDLETVVDTLGLERFPLLGVSQGGATAVAYAVRHPERVSHLILYGAYARGRYHRTYSPEEAELGNTRLKMIEIGWGKDNPAFRQFFTTSFMPEATPEQMHWFNDLQRISTSPENAIKLENVVFRVNVSDLLKSVSVPTLVIHAAQDGVVPLEEGRYLATHIPGAHFVALDSKNHILLETEPAWGRFLAEVYSFLEVEAVPSEIPLSSISNVDTARPAVIPPAPLLKPAVITRNLHLPPQHSPIIGREKEISEIRKLLLDEPACRVLTLMGPGGIGKSRLAVEAAGSLLADFYDGIHFIPLQPLTSVDMIPSAIAEVLQVHITQSEDPLLQLLAYLQEKELLLVMDNFEHILEGAGLLTRILEIAWNVKILVTSRVALNLRDEWLYPLQGLNYPMLSEVEEDIASYSAVKLFAERARQVNRNFSLENEEHGVRRICQMVEGMPLALELAAAWTKTLGAGQIANEIQRNLNFLVTQIRDVPERQRSIQAVFTQSWNMLNREERSAFKRLSVFRGGFGAGAAQQVASASLPVLLALVDQSLLRQESGKRYQIHDLLRQYAGEQLAQDPEDVSRIRDLHCAYYANFLCERQNDLFGDRQKEAIEEVNVELDNIRSAGNWALEQGRIEDLGKSIQGLDAFYQYQSRFIEGLAAFDKAARALEKMEKTEPMLYVLAQCLVCLGWFHVRLGQIPQAWDSFEKSQKIFEAHSETFALPLGLGADPLGGLAIVAGVKGEYQLALELGNLSLQQNEALGDQRNISFSHYVLTSACLALGQYEQALFHAQQAYDRSKNRWFMAYCLNEWGNVARAMQRYAEAKQKYQESYEIRESLDDPEGMAVALNHLGSIAVLEENYSEAQDLYQKGLAIYKKINDRGGFATSLLGIGNALWGLGKDLEACQYFYRALAIANEIQFIPLALSILMSISEFLIQKEELEFGIELLTFSAHHPSSNLETRQRSGELIGDYKSQLPADCYSAAVERGKGHNLDSVTRELLKRLEAESDIV
jgi:predicted ATPase/DNA-binding SARP family transcriptional activator/pimeloyl-ACP methyl ester carboxylesterase